MRVAFVLSCAVVHATRPGFVAPLIPTWLLVASMDPRQAIDGCTSAAQSDVTGTGEP